MKIEKIKVEQIKDLTKRIKGPREIFCVAIAAIFLISLIVFLAKTHGSRYIFRFQSVDSGRNNVEWRLLPSRRGAKKVSLYVDELLLGPQNERSRPIFSPGTKAIFCFERGKTLYVNLTSDLLVKGGNASDIMEGIEIFKMNIKRTFPKYKQVEIYIENKGLYKEF
ncbi:MAG: GerMN domain-containing protein [Treponema sp.]|nr:GerMN domain-containing protein [Treponema sp.]